MAEKDQQAYHPPAASHPPAACHPQVAYFYTRSHKEVLRAPDAEAYFYTRSDKEVLRAPDAEELRRQKRKKWILYGAAFVVFQTAIIVIFSLTIMKVKTPKFRVRSASFDTTFDVQPTNSSFDLATTVQLGVKNTNFGPYKYDDTTVNFLYGDTPVGTALVQKSKANFLSTKKVSVSLDITSTTLSASDISSRIISLRSQAKLTGKVELMLIFKKKKSVNMDCTMEVNTITKMLQNIKCK